MDNIGQKTLIITANKVAHLLNLASIYLDGQSRAVVEGVDSYGENATFYLVYDLSPEINAKVRDYAVNCLRDYTESEHRYNDTLIIDVCRFLEDEKRKGEVK